MSSVKVTTKGNQITVSSPYDAKFVGGARQLGGKFERAGNVWTFDGRYESNVRELLRNIYGTDGTPTATVTMHVRLDEIKRLGRLGDEVKLGGRQLLKKFGRDSAPKVAEGVAVISGNLRNFGGSSKYPSIEAEAGTVLEVLNVPVDLASRLVEEDSDAYIIIDEAQPETLTPAEVSLVESLRSLTPERLALVLTAIQEREVIA